MADCLVLYFTYFELYGAQNYDWVYVLGQIGVSLLIRSILVLHKDLKSVRVSQFRIVEIMDCADLRSFDDV